MNKINTELFFLLDYLNKEKKYKKAKNLKPLILKFSQDTNASAETSTPSESPPTNTARLSDQDFQKIITGTPVIPSSPINITYTGSAGAEVNTTYSSINFDPANIPEVVVILNRLAKDSRNSGVAQKLREEVVRITSPYISNKNVLTEDERSTLYPTPPHIACGNIHNFLYFYKNVPNYVAVLRNYQAPYTFDTCDALLPIFKKIQDQKIPGNNASQLAQDIRILEILKAKNNTGITTTDLGTLKENTEGQKINIFTLVRDGNPCNAVFFDYYVKTDIQKEQAEKLLPILQAIKEANYGENKDSNQYINTEITRLQGIVGGGAAGGGQPDPPVDPPPDRPDPTENKNIFEQAKEFYEKNKEYLTSVGLSTFDQLMRLIGGDRDRSAGRREDNEVPIDDEVSRESGEESGREGDEEEPRTPRRPPPPTEAQLAAQRRRAIEERRRRRRGTSTRRTSQIVPLVSTVSREGRNIGLYENKALPASAPIEEKYVEVANDGSGWKETALSNPERRELIKSMRGTITKPKNHLDFLRELERSRISGAKGSEGKAKKLRDRATSHQGRRNWR